jgi:peptidoglycan/xylan/chitin deacetylase (PgdA/CDA1 family)
VTFGSHTLTHPHLTALSEPEWRRELTESKRLLEDRLGRPVETLAYPYGDFSPAIAAAAREAGYRAGFTTIPGLNSLAGPAGPTDPAALRRMNIRRHAGLWQFRRKVAKMARLDLPSARDGVY